MPRAYATLVRIDQNALHLLNRFRRGTHQPLARLLSTIIRDYLDAVRTCDRGRPSTRRVAWR